MSSCWTMPDSLYCSSTPMILHPIVLAWFSGHWIEAKYGPESLLGVGETLTSTVRLRRPCTRVAFAGTRWRRKAIRTRSSRKYTRQGRDRR